MKSLIAGFVVASVLLTSSSVMAQHTTYYVPAPVVTAPPVYAASPVVTTYRSAPVAAPTVVYRPAPVVTNHSSPVVVNRPAVPVMTPAPVVVGRPAYSFYSPYGGPEVRVPGQPVRNFFRAIIP